LFHQQLNCVAKQKQDFEVQITKNRTVAQYLRTSRFIRTSSKLLHSRNSRYQKR